MRKSWCIFLSLLLIAMPFSACTQEEHVPSPDLTKYISSIMESPGEQPQLSREEFSETLDNYLSTGEWVLSPEKAFMHTSGVNCSWYIIDQEYLFFLSEEIHYSDISTGAVDYVDYDFCLSHYADGVEIKTEKDPLLFKEFLQ